MRRFGENKDEVQAQEIEIKKLQKELWEEKDRNKKLNLENRGRSD